MVVSISIEDLTSFLLITDGDLENYDITTVPQETLDIVEADSFWGVSKLLDGIQVRLFL